MDKVNYKLMTGYYMPDEFEGDEFVRVVYFDGTAEYAPANLIEWGEVEMYAPFED